MSAYQVEQKLTVGQNSMCKSPQNMPCRHETALSALDSLIGVTLWVSIRETNCIHGTWVVQMSQWFDVKTTGYLKAKTQVVKVLGLYVSKSNQFSSWKFRCIKWCTCMILHYFSFIRPSQRGTEHTWDTSPDTPPFKTSKIGVNMSSLCPALNDWLNCGANRSLSHF